MNIGSKTIMEGLSLFIRKFFLLPEADPRGEGSSRSGLPSDRMSNLGYLFTQL